MQAPPLLKFISLYISFQKFQENSGKVQWAKTIQLFRIQYRSEVNFKKGELISVTPLKSFKSQRYDN